MRIPWFKIILFLCLWYEIAVELRELASRAQSLLTKLADSGLMTAEEVSEQKRRFTW